MFYQQLSFQAQCWFDNFATMDSDSGFAADEISAVVKENIENVLGSSPFQQSKVSQWSNMVIEQTLAHITKHNKPYKYIVNCVIMQKNGAGLHVASSTFWDPSTDGSCCIRWENKAMYCVVSVYGCAI